MRTADRSDAATDLAGQIVDALIEPVLLLDPNGRVQRANAAAHEWFGTWIDRQSYVSVLRQPGLLAPVEDAFFRGTPGHARFSHSSGAVETLFDVTVTPLRGGGARPRVLLVFRDVSGRHDEESMRRDFVANVSHELKTPLTAMRGFIETLMGPARGDPVAQERFLATMAQEVARMSRLVSDLLTLSRLEGLARRRPTEVIDLRSVLAEAVEMLGAGAEVEDVTLVLEADTPAPVRGDRDQLMQVASNLIENAVKYGARPGGVRISVHRLAREPVLRGPAWVLEVSDDGPGVPPEHVPRLTERFYRVDTGRSRAQGGTGLGLSIVKHIVNRHRGRLKIESTPGQGTTVSVTLPEG
ncbi:ATP-binding protein [Jannaschia seohaensis]|uniref:histidine kinase n=1 Tax=Jannaschia seohaensis TaxID=475081 RepID=A0A2Y9AUZ6_9RHOB|nr:ATP-binding protein [Jannaschia seohaensis]PWJ19377.1 two-component system phosphate regulon sensor histidine kinase PhoR [Jannaschia seohaensis]SSA46039.1 two-component system, OmpR family, phosphate regulon sensor histidine kinase PhoR [Jannaschia seohaensis]